MRGGKPGSRSTMAGYLKVAWLALPLALCTIGAARAEDSCADIQRNYELVKPEAISVQVNSTLFAAADSGCEDLARRLIADGASGPARAPRERRLRVVVLFLANGAPVNARNVDGGTALFAAAEREKPATVKLLLDKGADPNLTGRSG